MYRKFDSVISEFSREDISEDYWYDCVILESVEMLKEFNDKDWKELFQSVSTKPIGWKKRLVECLGDIHNDYELEIILKLLDTTDRALFIACIDSLRSLSLSGIDEYTMKRLKVRINETLVGVSLPENEVLRDFIRRDSSESSPDVSAEVKDWMDEFAENKLTFRWKDLKIGRFGYDQDKYYMKGLLDDDFVLNYAKYQLALSDNKNDFQIKELIRFSKVHDESEISRLLDLQAESRGTDWESYLRWRYVLAAKLLKQAERQNSLSDTNEINEFWLSLNSPDDMPDIQKNATDLISVFSEWLEKQKTEVLLTDI